jgi:hypothetical protein
VELAAHLQPIKTVQAAVDAVTKEAPNKVKRYVATGDSGQGMTGAHLLSAQLHTHSSMLSSSGKA